VGCVYDGGGSEEISCGLKVRPGIFREISGKKILKFLARIFSKKN
jgi:hypothetical protein